MKFRGGVKDGNKRKFLSAKKSAVKMEMSYEELGIVDAVVGNYCYFDG